MLKVRNRNSFDLVDRYNGQDFVFPVGKTVALDMDAARHIFGFGADDKAPFLTRQGWMRHSGEYDSAMKILNGFSFDAVNDLVSGEQIIAEQGSAPLPGAGVDAATDAPSEASAPTPPVAAGRRSILDQLAGG